MRYRTVWPQVQVRTAGIAAPTWTGANAGRGLLTLPQGAEVPEDVAPETIRHLLSSGLIEPVDDGQADDLPPAA